MGYRLLAFPDDDRLFARIVNAQIEGAPVGSRTVRAARRRLRQRYPGADLHRQLDVVIDDEATDVWFAYREGRRKSVLPAGQWWRDRGVARVAIDNLGRLTRLNGACRTLLGLARVGQPAAAMRGFIPSELCREFVSLASWIATEAEVTSSATLRLPSGNGLDVEFHATWNGIGPDRHDVALRSLVDRDRASAQQAFSATSLHLVSAGVRQDLLGTAIRRDLTPGERLSESVAGDPWAVLVVSGVVRLYLGAEGLEPTILYRTHGSLLGSHWAPPGETLGLGLQSVTPSTILQLSAIRVNGLVESDPGVARAILTEGQQVLEDLLLSFASRSAASLPQRLAREILLLADMQPDDVFVPVTEQQLADGVGSIRESIGRTIADFRRHGWLATTRHGVIVLDRGSLRELANAAIS
jgi:CRP/FNR family transcriptional regulator, cyclic AMP receptor protein